MRISSSASELVSSVSDLAIARILEGIDSRGIFHVALTGGNVGGRVCENLISRWNAEPKKFHGLHVWWGDERFVEEGSVERNAHVVLTHLRADSGIHIHQVLSSDANVGPEVAATRYAFDIAGIQMDVTLLGVGTDGHVASLFPGNSLQNSGREVIAVEDAPKPPPVRISFSLAKINESTSVWLLASGTSKQIAVARMLAHDTSIPATLVHGQMETLLFVDSDSLASG